MASIGTCTNVHIPTLLASDLVGKCVAFLVRILSLNPGLFLYKALWFRRLLYTASDWALMQGNEADVFLTLPCPVDRAGSGETSSPRPPQVCKARGALILLYFGADTGGDQCLVQGLDRNVIIAVDGGTVCQKGKLRSGQEERLGFPGPILATF